MPPDRARALAELTRDSDRGHLQRIRVMRATGTLSIAGPVSEIELPDPRPLADDEALIAVRAAGVANWDEIVRQGGWDEPGRVLAAAAAPEALVAALSGTGGRPVTLTF